MPGYKIELNSKPNKGSNEYKLLLRITVNSKHSRIALDYSVLKKLKDFTANFRAIRAWFYKAIDAGLVQQSQNPFFNFKLKSGNPSITRLTEEKIKTFEE